MSVDWLMPFYAFDVRDTKGTPRYRLGGNSVLESDRNRVLRLRLYVVCGVEYN